ncbi:Cell division protein FtsY homolog [Alysiella crassa]|uniref:Signal recognition particle receptor FtsY n=2 Tax=Alysiella crassa TaxID=153491 RepID=A0A376BLC7_9NEIS|nr:Cell division protein FtsY homolog [Alysiella crassa]
MTDTIQKTDAKTLPTEDILELDFEVDASEPSTNNAFDDADDFIAPSADSRSSNDILQTYSLDSNPLDDMEEIDADVLLGEMDDIEAELLALRQQLEAETQTEEEIYSEDEAFAAEMAAAEEAEAISSEAEPEVQTTIADDDELFEPAEAELDSFAAFAAELFEAADSGDYGVNSQRFKPDDYDVASETAEIAPVHIDEDELETIDGSDLEALFGLSDDYTPSVNNNHGFLADAAQLDEQDDLPELLPETEKYALDEAEEMVQAAPAHSSNRLMEMDNVIVDDTFDDEPELSALAASAFENIEFEDDTLFEDTQTAPVVAPVENEISLDDDVLTSPQPAAAETLATAEKTVEKSSGLNLGTVDDDPMAWLDKMKNEMASKFAIDIDKEAAELKDADLSHLYDDLEEFDDKNANLGDNLNKLPEFDETSLANHTAEITETISTDDIVLDDVMTVEEDAPVVKRPVVAASVGKSIEEVLNLTTHTEPEVREVDSNISLDDIWAEKSKPAKVDLTAEPLDETELELFDETSWFGTDTPSARAPMDTELELDFANETVESTPQSETANHRQPENDSVDLMDSVNEEVNEHELLEQIAEMDLADDVADSIDETELLAQISEMELADDAADSVLETPVAPSEDSGLALAENTRQPESENDVIEEIETFEDEIDFTNIVAELPAETLEEVSLSGMDELERVSAEITAMEDFVPPKTKLMELMEAERASASENDVPVLDDVAVDLHEDFVLLSDEEIDLSNEHVAAVNVDEAIALGEENGQPEKTSVLESISDTVKEWEHDAEEWVDGMAHALKDKAEELEMRGEILVHEVSDALKHAEEWVDDFTDVLADKVEELELRAEILAHEVVDGAKDILHLNTESADTETIDLAESQSEPEPETVEVAESHQDRQPEKPTPELSNNVVAGAMVGAATAATATALSPDELEADKRGWASRLKAGLSKSRNQMAKSLAGVFGGGKIDEDLYEELETTLLISDMGIEATEQLMKEVRNRVSLKGLKDGAELRAALKEAVYDLLRPLEKPLVLPEKGQPFVIMMAGINGAGKTTSIGKLAKYFQAQGKSVMLAAGDTFRAAAREQLQEWGARNGVTVISQASGDSAAVCFDAVESAKAKGIDVVLADTAGRLPTQLHLMEEIKKVKRVLQKAMPDAPHEIMVVLDANIGQNAINQVVAFDDALGVTGLIVTKLDGTAKGGVLAALASNRPIPVRYIGVGEGIDDLRPFDARAFVDALLDEADN